MRLKTIEKGRLKAEEISALKSKYEEPLNRDDYLKYVFLPGGVFAFYGLIFTYTWWVVLILFIFGSLYGFYKILPWVINQDYYINSLTERDNFIVNITQILSDKSKNLPAALSSASARANGELKKDLKVLEADVTGSDKEEIREGFKRIRDKYKYDSSFCQYMEQLETIAYMGKSNLDTLKDLKSQHLQMYKKQMIFNQRKESHYHDFKSSLYFGIALLLILEFGFGFKISLAAFCHNIFGYATGFIYLGSLFIFANNFRRKYFDDDIMSVKIKVK